MDVTDMTPRARKCYSAYDSALAAVLRMYPWPFATKRAQLSQKQTKPIFGFSYYYGLPSDLNRIIEIETGGLEYKIEAEGIATNAGFVNLLYVSSDIPPDVLDPSVVEVVAYKLAEDLSISLLENMQMKEMLHSLLNISLAEARNVHAVEDYPQHAMEGDWMVNRLALRSYTDPNKWALFRNGR